MCLLSSVFIALTLAFVSTIQTFSLSLSSLLLYILAYNNNNSFFDRFLGCVCRLLISLAWNILKEFLFLCFKKNTYGTKTHAHHTDWNEIFSKWQINWCKWNRFHAMNEHSTYHTQNKQTRIKINKIIYGNKNN